MFFRNVALHGNRLRSSKSRGDGNADPLVTPPVGCRRLAQLPFACILIKAN
jgi:hypothetical protein